MIRKNLRIAFPEKSYQEINQIIRRFYTHFVDNFLEAVKLLTISEQSLKKRVKFNPEIFHQLHKTSAQPVQVLLGHTFNWEWVNVRVTRELPYPFLVVYMPVGNTLINRVFKHFRERTGSIMISATQMRHEMLPYRNTKYIIGLVADQNPGWAGKAYWARFFGNWTPFVTGPEKNARFNHSPVVFANITRPKRGYYEIETTLMTNNARELKDGELTLHYIQLLETAISRNPENYLWSHNRWKHAMQPEYEHLKLIE